MFAICSVMISIYELIRLRKAFVVLSCCSYVQKRSQYVYLKVACINKKILDFC
jgi:hypothetical protein